MKILKGYTKNLYLPEASIVERYIAEKTIEFCSEYIEKAKPVGLPESRHDDRVGGKGSRGLHVITPSVGSFLFFPLFFKYLSFNTFLCTEI